MADPRFFTVSGPMSAAEIARRTGAVLGGAARADLMLRDVAPLDTAGPEELSFLDNRKYLDQFRATGAGAVFVQSGLAKEAPAGATLLLTEQPYRAYAVAAQAFYPEPPPLPGVASSAVVDPTARLGEGTAVEALAVIGPGAEIGRRCRIGAHSVVGAGVVLGDDVRIGPHVTISHALIGARVRLYPGVRIGQDGFGFALDPKGYVKVPQLGRVIIGDDVEIGANTTIDRGAGPDTVIGAGTMIDNLVQIGHNVQVGRGCVLVSQAGISGSTRLGDQVIVAGQGGLIGHLTIGSGARIGAQAGVMRDVAPGETVLGAPAQPIKEFFRQTAALQRLARRKGD
ncbi:MAG TPA: UDP-3-O-(3-hydroxymyristoyl)glucosamine N-acyltransferase [Stellaceae bacterium]|jgi:UDP-3-O-[3-hydroxymyristoyl] glucosamine N-acyltransferase|nr:UDP-3-O-(3-hydroxymyristoyl)glucosamine N-acyltransferase [Stellaceae bacterium]